MGHPLIIDDRQTGRDHNITSMFAALPNLTGDITRDRRICELACATAGMETNYLFVVAPLVAEKAMSCNVIPIGFEPGSGVDSVAWNNPTTRQWLITNKLIGNVSPANPTKMDWHPRVRAARPARRLIASMFEDVLRYQLYGMVRHFSYGCTQRHLMYSGSEMGGTGTLSTLPQTWSELRSWYQNQSREDVLTKLRGQYAYLPGEDDQSYITWLAKFQVGGGISKSTGEPLAVHYYYGKGGWAATSGGWKAKLAYVRSLVNK